MAGKLVVRNRRSGRTSGSSRPCGRPMAGPQRRVVEVPRRPVGIDHRDSPRPAPGPPAAPAGAGPSRERRRSGRSARPATRPWRRPPAHRTGARRSARARRPPSRARGPGRSASSAVSATASSKATSVAAAGKKGTPAWCDSTWRTVVDSLPWTPYAGHQSATAPSRSRCPSATAASTVRAANGLAHRVGHHQRVRRPRSGAVAGADVVLVGGLAVSHDADRSAGLLSPRDEAVEQRSQAFDMHRKYAPAEWGHDQLRHQPLDASPSSNAARTREINDSDPLHDVVGVPARRRRSARADRASEAAEVEKLFAELAEADVVVRGRLRRQRAARRRRPDGLVARRDVRASSRTPTTGSVARRSVGGSSRSGRRWRCTGPAEFNKSHVPAFLADEEPRATSASTRSSAPTSGTSSTTTERRRMLAEHGKMARDYPDVRANTVAVVRARRLRVDARVRGRRAAPDRRPDAAPARLRDPAARARGGAVLHRRPASRSPSSSTGCPDRRGPCARTMRPTACGLVAGGRWPLLPLAASASRRLRGPPCPRTAASSSRRLAMLVRARRPARAGPHPRPGHRAGHRRPRELCLGPIAESCPPQCGGPALVGWDWADRAGRASRSRRRPLGQLRGRRHL